MKADLLERIAKAKDYILSQDDISIGKIGIILGSGLGYFTDEIKIKVKIAYDDIPGFLVSTAPGHQGYLVFGEYENVDVVIMQGRLHYYEGYSLEEVTFPIHVLANIGVESLIISNASGGINTDYSQGDIMIIKDHINFLGLNPLRGLGKSLKGIQFQDMTNAYDSEYQRQIHLIAKTKGIEVREGVYLFIGGPSYETPAEIRFFRYLGADSVGMSTVPEVIVARSYDIRILGLSCITNMAAGVSQNDLDESEVVKVAFLSQGKFNSLIGNFIRSLGGDVK